MKNTFLFILYISFSAVYAQTGTIKGSVTDVSGNPIIHAHIYLEKHKYVVASDVKGAYLLLMFLWEPTRFIFLLLDLN